MQISRALQIKTIAWKAFAHSVQALLSPTPCILTQLHVEVIPLVGIKEHRRQQSCLISVLLSFVFFLPQGVNITNFSGSFSNGLAFCALIHKFNPDKFDYTSLSAENREYNFQLAFDTGE